MELILLQNLSTNIVIIRKTRRYRALLKFYNVPLVVLYSINKLFFYEKPLMLLSNRAYITELKAFFLKDNIWYFYRNIIYKNLGLITSNLHKSYTFWSLQFSDNLAFQNLPNYGISYPTNIKDYTKHIKALHFPVHKKFFKKLILYYVAFLLKSFIPFSNSINLSHCYLIISNDFSFIWFYNFYYFKIYNY